MTNLFSWLLKRFMAAFTVLVVVQLATFILGLNLILSGYESNRLEQYEKVAFEILNNPETAYDLTLPGTNPFFVFSAEKELIFSNKGKGRSISTDEILPVYSGQILIGYYHAGEIHFTDNQANRVFLISIIILSVVSIILSAVIGFLSAWFSSGKITAPVKLLRRDIHDIRSLKIIPERTFKITELVEMSADVSEVSKSLHNQEEYKRQWLRDLAHDLRTPLAGLKSQLEAMADGVLDPSPERFKRHLLEIDRLESLAASIGELMAIEARAAVDKVEIGAARFAEQIVAPFEIEMQKKHIKLETDITAKNLKGDEQLLLRGIGNIFANSVKFVEDGGQIWLNIYDEDGMSIIEIANNGPEIPASQYELIFTRLFRGDSGRTTPGSGLGLSITREIIRLHGGEVRLASLNVDTGEADTGKTDTQGVRFIVTLP